MGSDTSARLDDVYAEMDTHLDRGQRLGMRLKPLLPKPARKAIRQAVYSVDPIRVRRFQRAAGDPRPIPPRGIRERNAVFDIGYWHGAALEATRPLHELLARVGHRVTDFERVLDFGCGGGKVAVNLLGTGPEIYACDIHAPSIAWLNDHFPALHADATGYDPPLPYADDHFDLLFAWSVLTHWDPERQRAWLSEWARVVRPGGLVLGTYLGPEMAPGGRDDVTRSLADDGVAYIEVPKDGAATEYFHGTKESYGDTYNTPESVIAMADGFDVLDVVPRSVWGMQGCIILRRV